MSESIINYFKNYALVVLPDAFGLLTFRILCFFLHFLCVGPHSVFFVATIA